MDGLAGQSAPIDYIPILIQLAVAVGFGVTTIIGTHLIGPKCVQRTNWGLLSPELKLSETLDSPFQSNISWLLSCFVIFDIEVIFMYPWAVNFREFGMQGLIEMFVFMGLLLLGFIYIIKKKALDWD
ncbi:NAD(P)H-quinone oxidoreductase subunit 3 [Sphingobacterium daejeonense]|nr:NAD(P)H-quinone oxidoreductase subunit 3 [Sphingobacterium daejeonense]